MVCSTGSHWFERIAVFIVMAFILSGMIIMFKQLKHEQVESFKDYKKYFDKSEKHLQEKIDNQEERIRELVEEMKRMKKNTTSTSQATGKSMLMSINYCPLALLILLQFP